MTAATNLGDGPIGRATRALFGATVETRGMLIKNRRRIAADELGLMPSTLRKYYEDDMVDDLVMELLRLSKR